MRFEVAVPLSRSLGQQCEGRGTRASAGDDFKVVPKAHVVRNDANGRADSRELPGSSPVSHFARSGQGVFQAMAAVAKLGYALA